MSMSKTTADDILNLDFDPDVLIDLIGKLSLDAIPLDVSDTLLNLENKMETSFQNLAVSSAEYAPHLFTACSSGYVPPPCEETKTSLAEPCPPVNVEKDRFLSSIGLSPRTAFKPPPKRRTSGKELSYILNRIEPPETAYNPVLEDPPSSPYAPVFVEDDVLALPKEEFDAVVKGFLTNLCDKNTLPGGELSFPPVSLSDFQPIAESDFLPATAVSDFLPATAVSDFLPATAVSGYQPVTVSDFQPAIVSGFEPAAVLDFQPALVTDFQPAAVSGFQPAPVLDFPPVSVSDFQTASVLDFGQAAVSDFQPASVLDLEQAGVSNFQPAAVSDFQPAAVSDFQPVNHTFNPPFHEIFQNPIRGNVIDIDLSTLDCRPKYDQTPSLLNEVSSDSDGSFPSLGSCSQEGLCSESSQASSVDKYVSSPDSGYTSCSSVISPCSLTDTSDTQCLYDISEEDDRQIDELVAALLEAENNFNSRHTNVQSVSSVVPVLTGSGDPEDYKERILNFLKEPLSAEKPSSPPPDDTGDSGSSSEPLLENAREEDTLLYFSLTKKTSSRMRELKQGFEFRYASKSDLRHSSLLSKLKLHTEKSKILKQIQEDEREQKRLKVIQVLDRKLKRGGHFLSPEIGEKIPQLENSLWQIQFGRSKEKAASLLFGPTKVGRNLKFSSETSCLLRTPAEDIENKRRKVQCKEA